MIASYQCKERLYLLKPPPTPPPKKKKPLFESASKMSSLFVMTVSKPDIATSVSGKVFMTMPAKINKASWMHLVFTVCYF